MFENGAADTDRSWSLDKSCEADAQGENRYTRCLLYKFHLEHLPKDAYGSRLMWLEIPEMGHDSYQIFTHPKFITPLRVKCS